MTTPSGYWTTRHGGRRIICHGRHSSQPHSSTRDLAKDLSEAVACIAGLLGAADDEDKKKVIASRVRPFLDAILPAHYCNISIPGEADQTLPPSNLSGISHAIFTLPGHRNDGDTVTSSVVGIPDTVPGTTTFATVDGWAVISDIDDTIKITKTGSPAGILNTTFVEEPQAVAGMPEFYAALKEKLDSPPFWYLSASPYNLYPFLRAFREQYYPPGTMLLRETSMMNLGAFLLSLTVGVKDYKTSRMEVIHTSFPLRKIICIGDSTQSDPESYADMYNKHPGWVSAIFIRRVTGVSEIDLSGKNTPERFAKAFAKVPAAVWYVFDDPKELYSKVDEVLQRRQADVGGIVDDDDFGVWGSAFREARNSRTFDILECNEAYSPARIASLLGEIIVIHSPR